jgi:putative transposase
VYDLGLYVVWCPEYRRPVLGGIVGARLRELIGQKAAEHRRDILAPEVMPDHVHLFIRHDRKASASCVVNRFKGHASHVLRSEFPHLRSRRPALWSRSYFAAPAGAVSAEPVRRYIGTQDERRWCTERSR